MLGPCDRFWGCRGELVCAGEHRHEIKEVKGYMVSVEVSTGYQGAQKGGRCCYLIFCFTQHSGVFVIN